MKRNKAKKQILEELKRVPIIQVACEKSGVSRNSYYVWKKEDPDFAIEAEHSLEEGEDFVNDMSESQLLSMIKEKDFGAIRFWLNHRHPKFKNKVEVTTKVVDEKLTPEQEEVVRKALELGSIIKEVNTENQNGIQ